MCPEPVEGGTSPRVDELSAHKGASVRASTSVVLSSSKGAVLSSSKGSARIPLAEVQLAVARLWRLLGILVAERQ
jgi:hypothetical protein